MTKSPESIDPAFATQVLGEILSYNFKTSKEGQIAMARAHGANLVGISAAGLLGTPETIRPINREDDPKLVRPFKKWLRRNGHKDFIKSIE